MPFFRRLKSKQLNIADAKTKAEEEAFEEKYNSDIVTNYNVDVNYDEWDEVESKYDLYKDSITKLLELKHNIKIDWEL